MTTSMQHLLCAKYCFKYIKYIVLFNPQDTPYETGIIIPVLQAMKQRNRDIK